MKRARCADRLSLAVSMYAVALASIAAAADVPALLAVNDATRAVRLASRPDGLSAVEREACALLAMAAEQWDVALPVWVAAARDPARQAHLSAYLALLRSARDAVPCATVARELLRSLAAARELAPGDARAVRRALLRLEQESNNWPQATALEETLGRINDWWFVAGSFSGYGSAEFREVFPPERDLAASFYVSKAGIVEWVPAPRPALGRLNLHGLVDPIVGWSYVVTALEIAPHAAGEAILEVETRDDFTIWWNGAPVLGAYQALLDGGCRWTCSVDAAAGVHWLLAKRRLRSEAVAAFAVSLYRADGGRLEFIPLPPSREAMAQWRLEPGLPPRPVLLPDPPAPQNLEQWLELIYRGFVAGDDEDWITARACWNAARFLFPDSIVSLLLLATAEQGLARQRAGSRERWETQVRERLEAVLEKAPHNPWAARLLVASDLSRSRPQVALRTLEQCLGEKLNAALRQQGLSLSPLFWLACAEAAEQLGLEPEARLALARATTAHPELRRARRRQARFLAAHGAADAAAEDAVAAWAVSAAAEERPEESVQQLIGLGSADQALVLARAWVEWDPAEPRARRALASALFASGAGEEALAMLQRAVEAYPRGPIAAQMLAEFALRAGRTDMARAAAARWLSVRPGDKQAQQMAAALGNAEEPFYRRYDAAVAEADRSRIAEWQTTRAALVYLIDIMVQRIERDHGYVRYTHQAVEILNRDGVEVMGELALPAGAEVLRVYAVLPSGAVHVPEHIQRGRDKVVVSLHGLEAGTIIDFAFLERGRGRTEQGGLFAELGFNFAAPDNPMVLSRLVVEAPEDLPLVWEARQVDRAPREERQDGWRALIWEQRNVDGLRSETDAPPLGEIAPAVRLTTLLDWALERARVDGEWTGRHEPSPLFAQALTGWSAGDNRWERARKALCFVRDEIADRPSGHTDLDALAARAGGVHARLALAARLVREAGVAARPAYLYDLERESMSAMLPDVGVSHSLALLVGGADSPDTKWEFGQRNYPDDLLHRGIWFNPYDRYAAVGLSMAGAACMRALLVAPWGLMWEAPEASAWRSGWTRRLYEVDLAVDGGAAVRARHVYEGPGVGAIRERTIDAQARRRLVEQQVVATGMPGIVARRAELFGREDREGPLWVDVEGHWPAAMRRRNDGWELRPITAPLHLAGYVRQATRQFPLDLRDKARNEPLVVVFTLPSTGVRWTHPPEDTLLIDKRLVYALTWRVDGARLVVARSFLLRPGLVDIEEYPDFVELCKRIDAAEQATLHLVAAP